MTGNFKDTESPRPKPVVESIEGSFVDEFDSRALQIESTDAAVWGSADGDCCSGSAFDTKFGGKRRSVNSSICSSVRMLSTGA